MTDITMQAWFSTQTSCSQFVISCHDHQGFVKQNCRLVSYQIAPLNTLNLSLLSCFVLFKLRKTAVGKYKILENVHRSEVLTHSSNAVKNWGLDMGSLKMIQDVGRKHLFEM